MFIVLNDAGNFHRFIAMRTEDFKFLGANVGYMLTVKTCDRIGIASFLSVFAVFGFKVISAAVFGTVGFYEFNLRETVSVPSVPSSVTTGLSSAAISFELSGSCSGSGCVFCSL